MCRIGVILLLASFVLEPKLVESSVSIQPTDMRAKTKLLVLPDTIIGLPPAVGDTFIDSIYVDGVDDLSAWQIYMTFNPVVLNGIELIEGPFLKQGGQTFFVPPCEGIDNSTGMITLCCAVILGGVPGVSGSGTIAYIRWAVVRYGSSKIHFGIEGVDHPSWECMLFNSNIEEIEFDMVDGYFSVSAGVDENSNIKAQISKLEVCPNPFTQSAVISYQLLAKSKVLLNVFDVSGRLVKMLINETKEAGYYSTDWDTNEMRGGIYFLQLETQNKVITKKIVVMR